MVKIENNETYKCCNSCGKLGEVNSIIVGIDGMNQYTVISLCDNCLNNLKSKIDNKIASRASRGVYDNKFMMS